MAFGNPYGDECNADSIEEQASRLKQLGIQCISLADTTGVSTPESIKDLFTKLIPALPDIQLSAHFHALPDAVIPKLEAAWIAGCRHVDTAIRGFGGCPLAADQLTGNMATELALDWAESKGYHTGVDIEAFQLANDFALQVFTTYH